MTRLLACLFIVGLAACQEPAQEVKKPQDAQDAGREFIRALLDGDYKRANTYLLKDATNLSLFQKQEAGYEQLSKKEKTAYKNAVIRPVAITAENDSTTIYKYYHTGNPSDTVLLRVIHRNNEWLVDLKSAFKM
jgi:hypothetical protein